MKAISTERHAFGFVVKSIVDPVAVRRNRSAPCDTEMGLELPLTYPSWFDCLEKTVV